MIRPASPYLVPGFYDRALEQGRHRDIVGGRWDETGRVQMQILREAGLQPHHRLLDIGAGSMRLGCKAVPFLTQGEYWATDASRALMLRGRAAELPDPDALPEARLIEDADFTLPGIPQNIDFAIAFGVFTHLPTTSLDQALGNLAPRLPRLQALLLTVFLAPVGHDGPFRQADGVVTHPDRAPWHMTEATLHQIATETGWSLQRKPALLPRGQALFQGRQAR